MARLPEGAVAAIVDGDGNFVARSIAFNERVGTPGTEYLLNAVKAGGRGIYEGVTFEGLVNYTAYATSDLSEWSAHVAISDALISNPQSRATSSLFLGALIAIVVGIALFSYVIKDMAMRRRNDQHLLELQKSEAISQFTTTIVHDFRNILSAIQAGVRLILRQTAESKTKEYAEMIVETVERGAKLSNRLLSFAREGSVNVEAVDVGQIFSNIEYLLQQAAGRGVTIQLSDPTQSAKAYANHDQLELALLNLVINARDAMNGEGKIEITTAVVDDHFEIYVSDDGPGVPIAIRNELFRPFFTTKADGKGTGLGLAQVAGMADQAGGSVRIEDAAGGGAIFVLRLRRATD